MIVKNWMQRDPLTVTGELLVSEAKRLISEHNLHVLPVVEHGRLRGMVTRHSCLRAGMFVANTQSADEFNFFTQRVKVKDIMVRRPATVDANDTMEQCLQRGRELGVAQFPVLADGQVVGVISANEIFTLAAHFLGAWEKRSGITLAPTRIGPGVIGSVADIVESNGGDLQAIYPISTGEPGGDGDPLRKIIIRFHAADVSAVVTALQAAGYQVLESVQANPDERHRGISGETLAH